MKSLTSAGSERLSCHGRNHLHGLGASNRRRQHGHVHRLARRLDGFGLNRLSHSGLNRRLDRLGRLGLFDRSFCDLRFGLDRFERFARRHRHNFPTG
ncbi:hypothetical protein N8D56_08155 [Devosia sp. A8/3-2]|nr:hypothetical protein N8D56_08155 [Devosia sp. A8/3-2]